MRIVIALGGNALLHRGERPDAAPQLDQVAKVAAPTRRARPRARGRHRARQRPTGRPAGAGERSRRVVDPALPAGRPRGRDPGTHRLLAPAGDRPHPDRAGRDPRDPDRGGRRRPGLREPHQVRRVGVRRASRPRPSPTEHDWTFARDGDGWRRVVASPAPVRIVETATAELLLRNGVTVVLAGGGGVPVIEGSRGLEGIEAVVDKDLVAALVAEELRRRPVRRTDRRAGGDGGLRHTATAAAARRHSRRAGASTRSRRARWDRRSKRSASSSPPPATGLPSAPSTRSPQSSPVRPVPRSNRTAGPNEGVTGEATNL